MSAPPVKPYIETTADQLEWVEELLAFHLTSEFAPIREELAEVLALDEESAKKTTWPEVADLLFPVIERAYKRALESR